MVCLYDCNKIISIQQWESYAFTMEVPWSRYGAGMGVLAYRVEAIVDVKDKKRSDRLNTAKLTFIT